MSWKSDICDKRLRAERLEKMRGRAGDMAVVMKRASDLLSGLLVGFGS